MYQRLFNSDRNGMTPNFEEKNAKSRWTTLKPKKTQHGLTKSRPYKILKYLK